MVVAALAIAASTACGGDTGTSPQVAATVVRVAGHDVTSIAGQATERAPTVEVNDANGDPVRGIVVHFAVTAGGGSLAAAVDTTGADGRATSGTWTLGRAAGANAVRATTPSVPGSVIDFSATGVAGAPVRLAFTSMPARVEQGEPVDSIVVELRDANDNLVSAAARTVTLVAPAGMTISTFPLTTSGGRASFKGVVLRGTLGTHSVAATASGMTPTSSPPFTLTGTTASRLEIVSGDTQRARAGDALPAPVVLRALTPDGAPAAGAIVTFAIADTGRAAGSLRVSRDTADAQGLVSVAWTLGTLAATQRLAARVSNSTHVGDVAMDVTAVATPGEVTKLEAIDPWPYHIAIPTWEWYGPTRVRALDFHGNAVPGVTVTYATTHGGSFTPPTVTTDANGEAKTRWFLGPANGVQTMTATTPGAGPVEFWVTAHGAGIGYFYLNMGSTSVLAGPPGQTMAQPIYVQHVDYRGESLRNVPVTITVVRGGGTVTVQGVTGTSVTVPTGENGGLTLLWTLGATLGEQEMILTTANTVAQPIRATAR